MNILKKVFIAFGAIFLTIIVLFTGWRFMYLKEKQKELDTAEFNFYPENTGHIDYDYTTENDIIMDFEKSPELESIYEDAMSKIKMTDSEKEFIRNLVHNENKTFEQAIQILYPSAIVIEETISQEITTSQDIQVTEAENSDSETNTVSNSNSSKVVNNTNNAIETHVQQAEVPTIEYYTNVTFDREKAWQKVYDFILVEYGEDFDNWENIEKSFNREVKSESDLLDFMAVAHFSDLRIWGVPSGDISHEPDF